MVIIQRKIIGKKEWELDSMYCDNMEGGKQREKDYAEMFKTNNSIYKYKVKISNGTYKKNN
jgi:hypothetical protein